MAIRLIDGVPGAGKTYYAVNHLAKHYFTENEDGTFDTKQNLLIITNIKGFIPEHLTLADCFAECNGVVNDFFSHDYQEIFTKKHNGKQIIYIIDECQEFWRRGERTHAQAFHYFELHRHLGHDIYLITQSAKKLPPDITCLAEYIVSAVPRTRSMLGEFRYKWISEGEIIKREALKPNQKVFDLYLSSTGKETEKIKNPMMKNIYLMIVAVVLLASGAGWYVMHKFNPSPETAKKETEKIVIGENKTVSGQSSLDSPVQEKIIQVKVNFISVQQGTIFNLFVLYDGVFLPIKEFPYPLKSYNNTLVCSVKSSELPKFSASVPEQKEEKDTTKELNNHI